MDDLRLHAVTARVVVWHNRHPLARRITAAQVRSIGYVALPYSAPGVAAGATPVPTSTPAPAPGADAQTHAAAEAPPDAATDPAAQAALDPGLDPEAAPAPELVPASVPAPGASLRKRAAARAHTRATEGAPHALPPLPGPTSAATAAARVAAFTEDFIPPLPSQRVAQWALQHGAALAAEPTDGPIRRVPAAGAAASEADSLTTVWVSTAAIECDGRRVRLLLGVGTEPAVLGRRVWSRARLGGALAAMLLLAATATWQSLPSVPAAPTLAASAPGVQAVASASAPTSVLARATEPVQLPPAEAPAPPPDAEPRAGSVALPALPPALDEATKAAARSEVAALRAAHAARMAALPAGPVASDDGPPEAAAVAAAPPPAASADHSAPARAAMFGLTTRLLRTRAESEQMQAALQALLVTTGSTRLRVEMLPAGEDWRVVCWPFERRDDAERARASLLARGIRLDTVDF